MNKKEIAELADKLMDDLYAWGADLSDTCLDSQEVWTGIKRDITCILRDELGDEECTE